MYDTSMLQIRLRNCLQTILDFEDDLRERNVMDPLMIEFAALKDVFGRLDSIFVQEDDVRRIEAATVSFFNELSGLVKQDVYRHSEQRFLQ